jgi:hypothetical protein
MAYDAGKQGANFVGEKASEGGKMLYDNTLGHFEQETWDWEVDKFNKRNTTGPDS